jgi:deoxyribonucleoside regulator
VGVGTVEAERASLLRAGYLTEPQLDELHQSGAVGDVCAVHFDLQGRPIDTPLTRRIVGIGPDQLKLIPMKLGIAGGQYKAEAIVGASRAGFINMLATDEVAATKALEVMVNK